MARLERRLPRPKELAPLLSLRTRRGSAVERRLAKAHTIWDLRRIAQRRTPSGPFDYTDGAADGETALRRAREAYEDLEFRPGVLRDVEGTSTATTVLGSESALPFGLAPTGFTRMMHAEGERAVAAAAERAGIPYALSTMGTTSAADVADAAPAARKWFQLYLWRDRGLSRRLVEDAKAAGYEALLVTVDVPVNGNRLRDLRNGMTIPPQLSLRTFLDASYRWEWWFNFLTTEPLSFAFDAEGSLTDLVTKLYDPTTNFQDLEWLRELWDGPILVKGVQTVADAEAVVDRGADGVILSNHGGRQLDRAPVPLHLLPDVAAAIGERATVMVDTGIMNGGDVVAAHALGADFALVGRAYLYGLMAGGESGVDRAIAILAGEAERTLKMLGVTSVEGLTPEHVRLMTRREPVR